MRNETVKRVTLWVLSIGGWAWAVGTATWAILEYDPQHGHFAPQWMSLSVFLSMGIAIAAGVSIGRFNSVHSLARIFEAGMLTSKIERNTRVIDELMAEREKDEKEKGNSP